VNRKEGNRTIFQIFVIILLFTQAEILNSQDQNNSENELYNMYSKKTNEFINILKDTLSKYRNRTRSLKRDSTECFDAYADLEKQYNALYGSIKTFKLKMSKRILNLLEQTQLNPNFLLANQNLVQANQKYLDSIDILSKRIINAATSKSNAVIEHSRSLSDSLKEKDKEFQAEYLRLKGECNSEISDYRKEISKLNEKLISLRSKFNTDTLAILTRMKKIISSNIAEYVRDTLANKATIDSLKIEIRDLKYESDMYNPIENEFSYPVVSLGVTLIYVLETTAFKNNLSPGINIGINPFEWMGLTTDLSIFGDYSSLNTVSLTTDALLWRRQLSSVGLSYKVPITKPSESELSTGFNINTGVFFESGEVFNKEGTAYNSDGLVLGLEYYLRNIFKKYPLETFFKIQTYLPLNKRSDIVVDGTHNLSSMMYSFTFGVRLNIWFTKRKLIIKQ